MPEGVMKEQVVQMHRICVPLSRFFSHVGQAIWLQVLLGTHSTYLEGKFSIRCSHFYTGNDPRDSTEDTILEMVPELTQGE